jgi:hypothetical protein
MKKFQRIAKLSWAVEVRHNLSEKTPDQPVAKLPAADSAGAQNGRPQPEPPKPETRANRAFHRIPAQSQINITDRRRPACEIDCGMSATSRRSGNRPYGPPQTARPGQLPEFAELRFRAYTEAFEQSYFVKDSLAGQQSHD